MLKIPKGGLIDENGFLIYTYKEVTSTNDLLMEVGREGAKSGTTVVARSQTAGKGSKGRSFYSPDTGFYISTLIRPGATENASTVDGAPPICPPLSVDECSLITPAVACAVRDAICHILGGAPVGIKWVNDIYFTGRKVAGILTESVVDKDMNRFYVIGIGVNIAPPEGGFPEEFADTATSMFRSEPSPATRVNLEYWILRNIRRRLNQIRSREFLYDYRRKSVIIGYTVVVTPLDGRESYLAEAVNIDHNARLIVKKANGELVTLNSEDVKMSLKENIQGTKALEFDLMNRMKNSPQ